MTRKHSTQVRCGLQRFLAGCLLLLFVSDLGFHLAQALATPEAVPEAGWQAGSAHAGLHSGCGIPGHDSTPFHHHHFPAVVSQSSFVLALTAFSWTPRSAAPEVIRSYPLPTRSRAPPLV